MANFLLKTARRASVPLLAGVFCLAGAEMAFADAPASRFQLKEAGAGQFVRLDSQTGAMSVCSQQGESWTCKSMTDDRAALHEEIAKLKDENAALSERLKDTKSGLPEDADLDRVMSLFEKYVERLLSFIAKLDHRQSDQGI